MAIGSSTWPRVHSVSQTWVQMRPQTLGNGLGSLGHAVGVVEAPRGDQSHVALGRGVHGTGGLARRPALALDGERRRHGVGERARDRGALGHAEVELVVVTFTGQTGTHSPQPTHFSVT